MIGKIFSSIVRKFKSLKELAKSFDEVGGLDDIDRANLKTLAKLKRAIDK